ncbi:MAG: hemagglutinin repeat-containing protein [Aquabacterium sp.]
MNKHLHRIVFNKARGLFMAVAECAGTAGAHQGAKGQAMRPSLVTAPYQAPYRPCALTLNLMLAWGAATFMAATPAHSQIVADHHAPGNQQPTVLNAASGVPVVNIQTPSAAGVSRNTYSQFDVQRNGVILNNSSGNVQTQLGGWVQGNPWVSAQGARIILNEVTSGAPSQLKGLMEVAGPRAQVVVANPAGIACDGCGFINANRGTLTTGTALINNGNLDGYRVTGGTIEINGAGLLVPADASQRADYTDLISRAVKVNAGIWANQLQVTTGVNQVSADQSVITPLSASQATDATPAFAIDTAQLGGMYAGKIVLVGTEAGVGVRSAGQFSATAGALTLTSDGQLLNTGTMQASTTLTVHTSSSLDNQGQMSAQTTTVQATTLNNQGTGRIYGDQLSIAATTLTQTGASGVSPIIAARQRLDIGVTTLQNNDGAVIYSLGDLFVGGALDHALHATLDASGRTTTLNNVGGRIEALGSLTLNATTLNNLNVGFTTRVAEVSRTTEQEYQLSGSPNRWQPAQITYIAGRNNDREVDSINTPDGGSEDFNRYDYTRVVKQTQVTSSKPANIVAGGDMVLTGDTLNNTDSRILAGGTLTATWAHENNVATHGTSTTTDSGTVTHLYRIQRKGRDEQGEDTSAYTPPDTIQPITVSPQVMQAHTAPSSVPGASGQTSVPGNGLLIQTPDGRAPLMAIDPKFANLRQWLSSDYMLGQLSIDPSTVQKRLGDGFYEQSLVQDQVAQLTGRRFLDGYSTDDAQYRALLDNGVTTARAMNLRPGIALTAAQVAQLTSDIVWLESTTVTLASGQTVQVLQPRVYLVPRPGDLQANGNLMAANNLNLTVSGDAITSGGIGAHQVLTVNAANIRNDGGNLNGQSVNLNASQDITSNGGQFNATNQLQLQAGRDVALNTTTASNSNAQGSTTYTDRVTSLYVSGATAQLLVNAARNLTVQGAQVSNQGAGGQTTLSAGQNLTMGTVQTSERHDIVWNAKNQRHDATSTEVGSSVTASGNVTLQAGQDMTIRGSVLQSDLGQLQATAAGNVNIEAAQTHQTVDETHQTKFKGLLSTKTTSTQDTADNTLSRGSALSASSVNVQAGRNLTLQGGSVTSAAGNTTLQAGQDVQILSAQDTQSQSHSRQESKSGLGIGLQSGVSVGHSSRNQSQQTVSTSQAGSSVSGQNINITAQRDATIQASQVLADQDISVQAGRNLDVTAADNIQQTTSSASSHGRKMQVLGGVSPNQTLYGRQNSVQNGQDTQLSQSTSVLSANGGNLTLTAGADSQYRGTGQGNVTTQGSDLLAGQAIQAQGNSVKLDTAVTASDHNSTFARQSSTTLGAQLSGTVGSRITSAWTMAQNSTQTDNERLAKAERLKAAYDAYKASQGLDQLVSAGGKQNATDTSTGSAFGVSVNLGNSSSQQQNSYDSTQVRGTNAQAKTIDVKSRDADITAVGAKLQATDITLDAAKNLNLVAAQNTASQHSDSKGHNAGVGVTVGFGQQNGISFQIGVGGNLGKANGSETTYDNTLVTATNQVNIKSGADTTLQGAQVGGNTVQADVGGKLNVITLQDTSQSESKQSSYGANISLCIPPICYGNVVTGSVNVAQSGFNHNYQSAVGQSGIAAGQGGFDIKVQGDTSLTGAAITSTADQSKNSLQTASLSYQDLRNAQNTDSYSRSIGLAYNGGSAGSTLAANGASNLLGNIAGQQGLPKNGSDSSSTLSVISPATITLTGTGNAQKDQASQQAAATLTTRDAKTANGALTNTLTLQQAADAQKDIQHAQENAHAGQIVGSVAFNVAGDIAASQKWPEGSPQKIALHGLAGLIQASAGGGNGAAGALAAMGNEALTKQINDYIDQQAPVPPRPQPSDPDYQTKLAAYNDAIQTHKNYAEAAASMIGASTVALANGLTGKGSAQDVQVGGQVALNADRFNRQLHPDERKWLADHKSEVAQKARASNPSAFAGFTDAQVQALVDTLSIVNVDAAATNSLVQQYGAGAGPAAAAIRNTILDMTNGQVFVDSTGTAVRMFTNTTVGRGGDVARPDFYTNSQQYSEYLPTTAQGIAAFSKQYGYAPPLTSQQLASLTPDAKAAYGTAISTQQQRESGGPAASVVKILETVGQGGAAALTSAEMAVVKGRTPSSSATDADTPQVSKPSTTATDETTPAKSSKQPGEDYATFYGEKVTPLNQAEVYHGTNKQTLGLNNMSNQEAAQYLYQNGLNARGTNIELQDHVAGLPDTAFRGTTSARGTMNKDAGALYWAGDDGLVIQLKNVPGYEVNMLRETSSKGGGLSGYAQGKATSGEQEISVPAKIAPENIEQIWIKSTNPKTGQVTLTPVEKK